MPDENKVVTPPAIVELSPGVRGFADSSLQKAIEGAITTLEGKPGGVLAVDVTGQKDVRLYAAFRTRLDNGDYITIAGAIEKEYNKPIEGRAQFVWMPD